jgi:catechol 2,3-dioxygenase-like lactoylglutathione lyase family enzyme
MSNEWYSRPVLFVSDMKRSIDFYVKKFGFTENWRFEAEEGNASVAQVARPGIELILAAESPEKMGKCLKESGATESWSSRTPTATTSTPATKVFRPRER